MTQASDSKRSGKGAPATITTSRRRVLWGLGAWGVSGLTALPAPSARAQAAFPSRTLTIVVPFAPGGIADITARTVGEAMARTLGHAVVIDNKPSAGGIVGTSTVAKAAPDGHTLLLMSNANAVSASLFKRLPFDAEKGFAPVSMLGSFDLGIFVAAASKYQRLGDLLAAAKAAPRKLTLGTIAVGSTQHLSGELFKSMAGVDIVSVPYRGTPAVITALRAGEIDAAFEIVGPVMSQVQSGDVRALAVTGSRRNSALVSVPTVQQAGLSGYEVSSWNGLAAPAGTPPDALDRLNQAVREALAQAAVQDRLSKLGMVVQASSGADMQAHLQRETKRWADVIRTAKIETE